jgi:uncharacterized membrane protein
MHDSAALRGPSDPEMDDGTQLKGGTGMAMTARTTMVGVFDDREQANDAVNTLRRAGFRDDQIGFAVWNDSDHTAIDPNLDRTEDHDDTKSGATGGAVTGALVGGAAGALMVPAIGPVIAGGILAAAMMGAAIGAATGGVIGSFMSLDVTEDDARYYENELRAGRSVVIVRADDRADEVAAILHRAGAYDVDALGKTTMTETAQAEGMGAREARFREEDGAIEVHAHEDDKNIEQTGRPEDAHTDHILTTDRLGEERMGWEGRQAS